MQSSCNLQRTQTGLIQRSVVSRKCSLIRGAALRGFTAKGEIMAMQPCCVAGGSQGRLTWAVTFMGYYFAHSQIAYQGKGMHDTPHVHSFLCSFMNESW